VSYIDKARQNKIDREELAAYRAKSKNDELRAVATESESIGANNAYADVVRQLDMAVLDDYSPISEGSLADVQMQDNINQGINYREPKGPSLIDDISSQLGRASDSVSDWFTKAIGTEDREPVNNLAKEQEFIQSQFNSKQEGEAELDAGNKAAAVEDLNNYLDTQY